MFLRLVVGVMAVAWTPLASLGQSPFDSLPRAQLLLLGTFHFADQGLDEYRPEFPWDALTPQHQREIGEVVELLARFRPTRIALEWPWTRQAGLDSLYDAWLAGRADLGRNESEQLGFRLARRLGHRRVYAVDAPARAYEPNVTQEEYDRRVSHVMQGADPAGIARQQDLEARFRALHRFDDSLKTTMPLRDYLLRENSSENLRVSHGQYLIGGFHLGRDDDYLGPDMRTRWYNRNLRILHNLLRIMPSGDERVLLIVGSGHVPILRHGAQASPEMRLVEVSAYLGR
jgi:hypothetical protein